MDEKEKLTQIVKAVQEDIGKFDLLYSQIINKVYFWCYTVVGNEADAKDATQEAMIRIHKKMHTLRNAETFNSWMYRLVRNSCITYLRAHKKGEFEFLHNDNYDESIEVYIHDERTENIPNKAYDMQETKELITKLVDALPRKQKEVITLYYLEEYKVEEIAKILDYNVGSVKSRLHAGRKNLGVQIEKYQEQNNVKLYTTAILPILGLILSEYRKELCDKQNLHFDNSIYTNPNPTMLGNLASIVSAKVLIAAITVAIVVAGVIGLNQFNQEDVISLPAKGLNNLFIDDVEMFNKANSNPYIDSISYLTFPTRDSIDIVIGLKNNVENDDIQILYNQEEISFEKVENELYLQVNKNGEYTIQINKKQVSFEITNIDEYAPVLINATNYGNYLKLDFDDEYKKIDYEKSYIEYHNEQYKIDNNSKVIGDFKGNIKIIVFHENGSHVGYVLYIE
ncbi:RNA polymerase sigma factor [Breznakia pachnodae]|uniref:RNA polymerase sigma factor (Sigma-70 family) n=1 Tax=Breznakia pachnodae TaxID=265178 RepID=A0ABU0E977_9FIRM|nr:RNA polymerase sigma factor [Breznakia pachnodae]MDQ0363050.1 RNA polymerase sigma factor (sigma-70 family) [Breznakia pachnodae]